MKYTSLTRYQRTATVGYNVQSDYKSISDWIEQMELQQKDRNDVTWSILVDSATGEVVNRYRKKKTEGA